MQLKHPQDTVLGVFLTYNFLKLTNYWQSIKKIPYSWDVFDFLKNLTLCKNLIKLS